jgi:large subunit ribosomal protein L30e
VAKDEDEEEEVSETTEEAAQITEEAEGSQEGEAETESKSAKKKKTRKVVRRRKSKKEKEKPLTSAIRLCVESGKVGMGARTGIAASLLGKAKLFVVASNTPLEIKSQVEKYSAASGIPLIVFEGSSVELGSVCGKPFPVSVLSIYEPGSSPIMELASK